MFATPHRLGFTALAVLSLLAAPLASAQQTAFAPAKDAGAITPAGQPRVTAMSPDMRLDFMGIRLNGPKANGKHAVINWDLGDGSKYGIELRNSVPICTRGVTLANPDATLSMSKGDFARLLTGGQQAQSETGKVRGNSQKVAELFSLPEPFDPMFNIVTP